MEELKPYWVLTPEYETYSGCYDPPEPPEYGRDIVAVLVFDEKDAKVCGIRAMRKSKVCRYIDDDPACNPFADLEVEEAVCKHGTWFFTEIFEDGNCNNITQCSKCQEEWEQENEFI
jgi:hypothetical protein